MPYRGHRSTGLISRPMSIFGRSAQPTFFLADDGISPPHNRANYVSAHTCGVTAHNSVLFLFCPLLSLSKLTPPRQISQNLAQNVSWVNLVRCRADVDSKVGKYFARCRPRPPGAKAASPSTCSQARLTPAVVGGVGRILGSQMLHYSLSQPPARPAVQHHDFLVHG